MADTESRHWWFVARREILRGELERLALGPGSRLLEVGSGTGGNLELLSHYGKLSAMEMDASARALANGKTGGRFDIRFGHCPDNIPFESGEFDLICMFDVLEHIDEDVETLQALTPLLAEGGRMLVTVPAYAWLWGAHDEFLHHKRRYNRRNFEALVAAAGLRLERFSYFNTLLFPLAAAVRIKERLLHSEHAAGQGLPAPWLNEVLQRTFASERWLLGRTTLPYGVSLLAVLGAR